MIEKIWQFYGYILYLGCLFDGAPNFIAFAMRALSLLRERYSDFGPSLATEKLAEHHGCSVSRETLRGWMIGDGLWRDRRHRLAAPHQPRRRRDCLGELVQIDGSEHAWLAICATCWSLCVRAFLA
jgi:hypothetical protein